MISLFQKAKSIYSKFQTYFFFEPKHYKDLKGHSYEKNFQNFMKQQVKQHKQVFNSWRTIDRRKFNGHQMLDCQWVFKYKTDKHGELQKCKAKIVMCGNQQHWSELFIQAITLVIVLRILLALFVKFNLDFFFLFIYSLLV